MNTFRSDVADAMLMDTFLGIIEQAFLYHRRKIKRRQMVMVFPRFLIEGGKGEGKQGQSLILNHRLKTILKF